MSPGDRVPPPGGWSSPSDFDAAPALGELQAWGVTASDR
jgi:hypothetical protein